MTSRRVLTGLSASSSDRRPSTHTARHRRRLACPAPLARAGRHSTVPADNATRLKVILVDATSLTDTGRTSADDDPARSPLPPDRPVSSHPSTTPVGRRRARRACLVALLILLVGGSIFFSTRSAFVRQQLLLTLTRRPDNFAELYFSSPSRLPDSFVPGRPIVVTFGVTNDSSATRRFEYLVSARTTGGRSTPLRSGVIPVRAGRSASVPVTLELPGDTTSLSVELRHEPLMVRFFVHRTSTK